MGGVVGRVAGKTLFSYSKAMKSAGFEWTEKYLFQFLLNPGKLVSGTKMAFAGLPDPTSRGHLIAYLASTS